MPSEASEEDGSSESSASVKAGSDEPESGIRSSVNIKDTADESEPVPYEDPVKAGKLQSPDSGPESPGSTLQNSDPSGDDVSTFKPKTEFINTSGSVSSTPSIKDALSGLKNKEENGIDGEASIKRESSEEDEFRDDEQFSEEDLLQFYDNYIETLQEESPRMYLALSGQRPEKMENGFSFRIAFRNNAQQTEFKQNFKIPLLAYLKENLNCNKLEIEEAVLEIDEKSQSKYYTDLDKLKFMIGKNPALKKLRKDFNLDFE